MKMIQQLYKVTVIYTGQPDVSDDISTVNVIRVVDPFLN